MLLSPVSTGTVKRITIPRLCFSVTTKAAVLAIPVSGAGSLQMTQCVEFSRKAAMKMRLKDEHDLDGLMIAFVNSYRVVCIPSFCPHYSASIGIGRIMGIE
jgi:hypothetical protein